MGGLQPVLRVNSGLEVRWPGYGPMGGRGGGGDQWEGSLRHIRGNVRERRGVSMSLVLQHFLNVYRNKVNTIY